jgi:outer membrane protein
MKKLFFLGLFLITLTTHTIADNIGVIDMELIFTQSKLAQKFESNLKEKRDKYMELLEKEQKKIEKEKSKGTSEEEIRELIQEIEEKIRPKQEEIMQLEASLQQTLLFTVNLAARDIAKEYGIDVVVDKRSVYYGGFDLTDFVITKINSENL